MITTEPSNFYLKFLTEPFFGYELGLPNPLPGKDLHITLVNLLDRLDDVEYVVLSCNITNGFSLNIGVKRDRDRVEMRRVIKACIASISRGFRVTDLN